MIVRALRPDGDIVTSGQHFVTGKHAVGQTIKTRLQLFLGEYFLDSTEGTDWFGRVLNKQGTLADTDALVQQRIIRTQGVITLMRFEADADRQARRYSLSCDVLTEYGEIAVETGGIASG